MCEMMFVPWNVADSMPCPSGMELLSEEVP